MKKPAHLRPSVVLGPKRNSSPGMHKIPCPLRPPGVPWDALTVIITGIRDLQEGEREFTHLLYILCWLHLTGECSHSLNRKPATKPTSLLSLLQGSHPLRAKTLLFLHSLPVLGLLSLQYLVIETGCLDAGFIISLMCQPRSNWPLTVPFSSREQLTCLWIRRVTPFTISLQGHLALSPFLSHRMEGHHVTA